MSNIPRLRSRKNGDRLIALRGEPQPARRRHRRRTPALPLNEAAHEYLDGYVTAMTHGDRMDWAIDEFRRSSFMMADRALLRAYQADCYTRGAGSAMGFAAVFSKTDWQTTLIAVHAAIEALELAAAADPNAGRYEMVALIQTLLD